MDYLKKMLREDLEALDRHDDETRRLIDNPNVGPSAFAGRTDQRMYLNARVINAARLVLDALEKQA